MCFVMSGILLWHPAQRIEILQSLGLDEGGHDALMRASARSRGSAQQRAIVCNRGSPTGLTILILDDKTKRPGTCMS